MSDAKNPLDRLDRQELLWLTGILKDACRERLEKNLAGTLKLMSEEPEGEDD